MRSTDEQLNAAYRKVRERERREQYLVYRRAWLVVAGGYVLLIAALVCCR